MRNRILWVIVSNLMVLSLLVACGTTSTSTSPATQTTQTSPAISTSQTTTAPVPSTTKTTSSVDTPKYGGTITYRLAADPTNFDSGTLRSSGALINTVYQQFLVLDWMRGPAGSNVTNLPSGGGSIEDSQGPQIAESWEMPSKGVWKLKIREGVHWQPVNSEAGRLMNGRLLTADDIVSGFNRLLNRDPKTPAPDSWILSGQPGVARTANITKTGPMEVTITTTQDFATAFMWIIQGAGFMRVYPPEVVAKYGTLSNWRNAVGTGPYILTDYVPGSQFLYQKNPTYWEKDPSGPGKGNQLPYADTLRELIIPDYSTTLAALRTGKLDLLTGVVLTDAQSLWQTTPSLRYMSYLNGSFGIGMRQDKKDKPYSDVRVRRALMMATDFESIKKNYYGGEAEVIAWPANSTTNFYEPLEKLTPAIQELYSYNPEKAKQLLKEAGYPNGFKVKIVVQSMPQRIDEMSIIKDMWSKIGVEVTLDLKETGAYATVTAAGNPFDEMLYRQQTSPFASHLYGSYYRGSAILNISHVNDPPGTVPYLEDLFQEQDRLVFIDMPKVYADIKLGNGYAMENAYVIPWPLPNQYNFWWPWLKNHYGAGTAYVKYGWIDQDLKESMGH
jgi:peptide/nickel transport system substrate-binding protein